jgi:DNA-binding XRE family transcriptional regulator
MVLLDTPGRSLPGMASKTKSSQRDPRRDELRRLGERVREQRRTRGLTQEALAEALDLSVAYVSLIERGGRNPPYTTVIAIARALGIPASSIVGED